MLVDEEIRGNRETPEARRAWRLISQYERTLLAKISDAMVAEYGEDWPELRLIQCECKDLLGKWRKRGGRALDYADWAHYIRIMSHPEHFERLFNRGFANPDQLIRLLDRVRKLRAKVSHPHDFSRADLAEVKQLCRQIRNSLVKLETDFVVEFD